MLLTPATRSSLIVSSAFLLSVISPARAFPELLGHVLENGHSHARSHAAPLEKRKPGAEEHDLYKRQLELLTGALGAMAPGLPHGGLGDLGLGSLEGPTGTFPLDTYYQYPWAPPGPYDQRSPCPAVNMMANHGIISRTGIVGTFELLRGAMNTFNLGFDIALLTVLAATLSGGDPVTWTLSIGGPDKRVSPPLGGLLGLFGEPQGLEHTHNLIEVDCSMTRNDIYDTGDAWTMNPALFMQFYNSVPEGGLFTHEAIAAASCLRWHQCEQWNPNFYYGLATGYFRNFAQMALTMWGNHSDGSIDGYLTHEIVYCMYGNRNDPVTGPFTYNFGWERIPDNWYRRPVPFDLLGHIEELVRWIGWCPALGSIGGNLGAPNTFTPLNLEDPVSGLQNLPGLLEGNNFFCFMMEMLKAVSPSFTNNLYASLFSVIGDLGCVQAHGLAEGGIPIYFNHMSSIYPGAKVGGPY